MPSAACQASTHHIKFAAARERAPMNTKVYRGARMPRLASLRWTPQRWVSLQVRILSRWGAHCRKVSWQAFGQLDRSLGALWSCVRPGLPALCLL